MGTDLNDEIKNHILYVFYSGQPSKETVLNESRGYVTGLHEVIQRIFQENKIYDQIKRTIVSGREVEETYSGRISDYGISSFFDDFTITIKTVPGEKVYSDAVTHTNKTFEDTEPITCHPDISIIVNGMDLLPMVDEFTSSLGHELTHVYNMFRYLTDNGLKTGDLNNNIIYKQRYGKIMMSMHNGMMPNEKAIANTLYLLNRLERNAYISQLEEELLAASDTMVDSKSVWKAVLKTQSYRKFKLLEKNILFITVVDDANMGELIRLLTNKIMGTNFTNFNQVKKYYSERWMKWKKKYLSTASKIAYDVFSRNNQDLDGGMSGDYTIQTKK